MDYGDSIEFEVTYQDTIFVPYQENGSMVYSGKFQGKQSHFTVSEKKTVMFQWGDMVYGPYISAEDIVYLSISGEWEYGIFRKVSEGGSAAIPKDDEFAEGMTGVALYQGEDILFRGGVLFRRYCLHLCTGRKSSVLVRGYGIDAPDKCKGEL